MLPEKQLALFLQFRGFAVIFKQIDQLNIVDS
jgi:hypothetical protein